jgi:RNA polymerase sigma-70 factor (ECF subfamily)
MNGEFEDRYRAFLETVSHLRTRLHRYCARMTGSVLDGEDVMQEALFEAYRKLESLDDPRALRPWLFRIAHNRCIDFLRRRDVRTSVEAESADPDVIFPAAPAMGLDSAMERLIVNLPPKERACVLLKDVFDHSLDEIAELVDSTVGGVKAALNRGRSKLTALTNAPSPPEARKSEPELLRLLHLYVERFNRHDWNGVRELASADARLQVADCFAGPLAESPYFIKYEQAAAPWKMSVGEVDGEPVVIVLAPADSGWQPKSVIRIRIASGLIVNVSDYYSSTWLVAAAHSVAVE